MQIEFEKLHPDAKVPTYGSDGAACFDLYAFEGARITPNRSAMLGTALAVAIPEGWSMLVFSRSGHGFTYGLRLSNCVGVIDSDYRGEIKVAMHNDGLFGYVVRPGERIAQAMLVPALRCTFKEVEALPETVRGDGGFGSTGK